MKTHPFANKYLIQVPLINQYNKIKHIIIKVLGDEYTVKRNDSN